MTALVRSSALLGFEPLASGLRLNVPALLSRFGIPVQALNNPDLLIPYQAFINLLEHTASLGECPDFGLRLAQTQGIDILGPIAVLLRHAGTLGDALSLASRYLFVHSPALRLSMQPVPYRPDLVSVVFDISHAGLTMRPQLAGLSLGIISQGVKALSTGRVRPLLATLPHAPVAPEKAYRQAFGCPVQFMAEAVTLRLAVRDLTLAISENDPQIKEIAIGYLARFGESPQTAMSERVRSLARTLLGAGHAGHIDIARALSVHPRTLQRRLKAEGATFERLLDDVRKEQFLELIALRARPGLTQVAHILGYSEVSALTRSCRRWFGATPRAMRARSGEMEPPGTDQR